MAILIMETQNFIKKGLDTGPALGEALKEQPISLVLMVINVAAASFICGLLGYHTYLLLTNQTTNEQLKKTWKLLSGNPYRMFVCFLNNVWDEKKRKKIKN